MSAAVTCELCSSDRDLAAFDVQPRTGADGAVTICAACRARIADPAGGDAKHWHCLRESMWSDRAAVKVLTYRILKGLGSSPLAQELLGEIYLDDETQAWADAGVGDGASDDDATPTRDSNGTVLQAGDTVTLIKDLDVKGGGFTAKRGTTVKGISLTDDPKYVEGRVNGIRIVLVAAYLKKS